MTKPIPSTDLANFLQRSVLEETLNEIGSETCKLWFGLLTPKTAKSRAVH
jgi:hypothetical protein